MGDLDAYLLGRRSLNPPSKVLGVRRMEHADLPHLQQLIRPETYDIFGDFNLGRIYYGLYSRIVGIERSAKR